MSPAEYLNLDLMIEICTTRAGMLDEHLCRFVQLSETLLDFLGGR